MNSNCSSDSSSVIVGVMVIKRVFAILLTKSNHRVHRMNYIKKKASELARFLLDLFFFMLSEDGVNFN